MTVYVCITYYDNGNSEINAICSSREVVKKVLGEQFGQRSFDEDIQEFEIWDESDFED